MQCNSCCETILNLWEIFLYFSYWILTRDPKAMIQPLNIQFSAHVSSYIYIFRANTWSPSMLHRYVKNIWNSSKNNNTETFKQFTFRSTYPTCKTWQCLCINFARNVVKNGIRAVIFNYHNLNKNTTLILCFLALPLYTFFFNFRDTLS